MKKLEPVLHISMLHKFGADFAYTLDGDTENEIQYENFNACGALVEFHGVSVHPGSSKDTMVNASLVAMEFDSMLPKGETPRDTEGYEGFYHLHEVWKVNVQLCKTCITLSEITMQKSSINAKK